MMKRSALLGMLLVMTTAAAPAAGAASLEADKQPVVIAHYMAWYQTPEVSGAWGHWQINRDNVALPFWRFPELRNAQGWRQASSVFHPVIGLYDSADPDLCEYHILLAWLAGIDAFACDWYGPRHHYDDIAFQAMRDKAAELGLVKVALCWEDQSLFPGYAQDVTSRDSAVALGREMLAYMRGEWFSSPAYLHLDSRPVLTDYAWGSPGADLKSVWLSAGEWDAILSQGAPRPLLLHDWHWHYWAEDDFAAYDGLLPWGDCYHGNTTAIPKYWNRLASLGGQGRFAWPGGTMLPGFDNRGCGGWGTGSAIGITRFDGGERLRASADDALAHDIRVLQIATWNDFNEGATVEPVRLGIADPVHAAPGYGYQAIEIIQEYTHRLKGTRRDTEALRLPALLYACRKIAAAGDAADRAATGKALDEARALLVAGQTAAARARLEQIHAAMPENLRRQPDLAVYQEPAVSPATGSWDLYDRWGIQACDPTIGPRYQTSFHAEPFRPAPGKRDILCIQPMSEGVPSSLTRIVEVPPGGARLRFSASANAAANPAGCLVTLFVDEREISKQVLTPADGWQDFNLDLAGWAGKRAAVSIVVRVAPGKPWESSQCFFSGLEVVGVDQPPVRTAWRFGGWAGNWTVRESALQSGPDFRDDFTGQANQPLPGRKGVLFVQPPSPQRVALVERTVWVPENGAMLKLALSPSLTRGDTAGFTFWVFADKEALLDTHVTAAAARAAGAWREVSVDLRRFAGRPVTIVLQVAGEPGAAGCFIADARVVGMDPPASVPSTALAGWALDWRISGCAADKGPRWVEDFRYEGEYPHPGRGAALVVHPAISEAPCVLERRVKVAPDGGALRFAVSADAARLGIGDIVCRVLIDDDMVYSAVVSAGRRLSAEGWRMVDVDLAPYAGRDVTVKIEIAAGGGQKWAWEYGFLADLEMIGVEPRALTAAPAAPAPARTALPTVSDTTWPMRWQVKDSGKEVIFCESFAGQPDFPNPGRSWIMALHPASAKKPCVLSRTVAVPAAGARLRFSASSDAAQPGAADFVLRVRVAGENLVDDVIGTAGQPGAGQWRDYDLDLARFVGRSVKIEIEIAGGGVKPWAWEYGYISGLTVSGVDEEAAPVVAQPAPQQPAAAAAGDWVKLWRVTNSGKEVRFRTSYSGQADYPPPGRTGSLALHPKSPQLPCRLTRTVSVPQDPATALRFAVAADADQPDVADCRLRVRIGGKAVLDEVIAARDGWQDRTVPLAAYAGSKVKIEIEIAAGGKTAWAWEYGFLADVVIDGVDR